MDFSKLLNGFAKVVIRGFANVALCISLPLPNKTKLVSQVSPRLVNKLTLATEQDTRSASGVYCRSSWLSTKTNINMIT